MPKFAANLSMMFTEHAFLDRFDAEMLYLAFTLWLLGEVDRAVSLVGDAKARIAGVAHAGACATGKAHAALFSS